MPYECKSISRGSRADWNDWNSKAAENYANSATYKPDGILAGFVYGNGIVRNLSQNSRGLLSSLEALPDLGTKEVVVHRAPEMAGMQAGK